MTTNEAESPFICDCPLYSRSACVGARFYAAHEGKSYCVLHFPGEAKLQDFKDALKQKLDADDFNLSGVWFPAEEDFKNFRFVKGTDFTFAHFNARVSFYKVVFGANADFYKVTFSAGANFSDSTFHQAAKFLNASFGGEASFAGTAFLGEAHFSSAVFMKDAYFSGASFAAQAHFASVEFLAKVLFHATTFRLDVDFKRATFGGDTRFSGTAFHKLADFSNATIKDYFRLSGVSNKSVFTEESSADFNYVRAESPDRVSFHTLTLRPHWFVNVDSSKFDFTNVHWVWDTSQEINGLKGMEADAPHRLLSIACRHLAVNAEERHRYEEASRFRYMAMDAQRRETHNGFAIWRLHWWYWAASGYGERTLKAFLALISLWLLFAWLYTQVGFARWTPKATTEVEAVAASYDEVGEPLRFTRALSYSLRVMSLQKPEPSSATNAAQTLVVIETILGPVQAALLALAIRRKFIR